MCIRDSPRSAQFISPEIKYLLSEVRNLPRALLGVNKKFVQCPKSSIANNSSIMCNDRNFLGEEVKFSRLGDIAVLHQLTSNGFVLALYNRKFQ